jgi:competence CoiA-like predicted nuclease
MADETSNYAIDQTGAIINTETATVKRSYCKSCGRDIIVVVGDPEYCHSDSCKPNS